MKNTVAYIVVGWNNYDLLHSCFSSINTQEYSKRVVIYVDNGSTDGSVDYIRAHFPSVICIENGKNYGFARGNNIGITAALKNKSVGYIALLNSDATLADNWTSNLVSFAKSKGRIAALQGITLDYYDHSIIDSTHIYLSRNGQATQGSYRDKLIGVPSSYAVFGVNAAAAMFTRDFIEKQPFKDFFDETMFMYLEDVDVAMRSVMMGYKNYCVKDTFAYHMGSASSKNNRTFPAYMTFRNNTGLLFKNVPITILIKLFPRIIHSDRQRIKHLKALNRKDEARSVLKGRLVGLLYIPIFILKRMKLRPFRDVDKKYLWSIMKKGY